MAACFDLSDEELEIGLPERKPIGWNYQNALCLATERKVVDYSHIPEPIPLSDPLRISPKLVDQINGDHDVSSCSQNSSNDDIEVIEVKKATHPLPFKKQFPVSSTRKEIRDLMRNARQSSITRFFCPRNKKPANKSTDYDKSKLTNTSYDKKDINLQDSNKDIIITDESTDNDISRCTDKEQSPSGSHSSVKKEAEEEVEITIEITKTAVKNLIERWRTLQLFSSEDDKIEEKLWKHFNSCHISYTTSRKFLNGLQKARDILNKENTYVTIKDVIDNLRHYKDVPYNEKKKKLNEPEEVEAKNEELTEAERKRRKKLRKIEKEMIKISKKIKELDCQEVDLDDEDNSAYLLQERYKRQFVALDQYYCKLADVSLSTGRPVEKKFRYEGSRYPEINKRITLWVNKHREFPDFKDVLDLVRKVTKDNSLPLRPESIRVQAQEIFRDVGKILKERREQDDLFSIYSYADTDMQLDPAESDKDLLHKLKENESEAKQKLDKIFQLYVDKEAETHFKPPEKEAVSKLTDKKIDENGREGTKEQQTKESDVPTNVEQRIEVSEGKVTNDDLLPEKKIGKTFNEESQKMKLSKENQETIAEEKEALGTDTEENQESDLEENQVSDITEEDLESDGDDESHEMDLIEQSHAGDKEMHESEGMANGDNCSDDSEDDIEEIENILAATGEKEDDYEDEEEDEEEETKDDFIEEDVEITYSPENTAKNDFDDSEIPKLEMIKKEEEEGILSNFTHFKRKIDVEDNYISLKRRHVQVPEVVELD